jgi:glyoxylase-like metal-dependent hydrolase (beta-lactamase superfamily II)
MITKPHEIHPGITILYGSRFLGRHPYVNAVELHGDTRVIIDPGLCHEEYLVPQVRDFDLVATTHSHPDHFSLNHLFPCPQASHPLEKPYLEHTDLLRDEQGLPTRELRENWERVVRRLYGLTPTRITRTLEDGDVLDLGRLKFRVVHTPGHSLGHIAFFEERLGILIAGDYDLSETGAFYSNAMADLDDWYGSMERLIELAPRIVLTGHCAAVSEDPVERMIRYKGGVLAREEGLYLFLKEPRTLEQIHVMARERFNHAMSPRRSVAQWYGRATMSSHLQRLIRLGRVDIIGERFVAA